MIETQSKDFNPAPADGCTLWALDNLPPFPAIASQILQLVSKQDVHMGEVGTLIAADPVFAADILQIANSALFALRSQVKTIAQAILILGLERVKGISLTRALGDYLSPALKIEALRRCWQHSLAGALLAARLARTCGIDRDIAYTAGLLRDIGRLALLVKYPHPYADMLIVTQEHGFDLMATERDLFDIDHCQAGYWLTEKMDMPPELREVVARHHEDFSGTTLGLVQVVSAAESMSEALGFGVLPPSTEPTFDSVLKRLPEPVRSRILQDPEQLRAEVTEKMRAFSPTLKAA